MKSLLVHHYEEYNDCRHGSLMPGKSYYCFTLKLNNQAASVNDFLFSKRVIYLGKQHACMCVGSNEIPLSAPVCYLKLSALKRKKNFNLI